MRTIVATYWRLAAKAILLRDAPYEEMRDAERSFLRGLLLILVISLSVALVAIVGEALQWATSPNPDDIQQVVWEGMTEMPWYAELERIGETEILEAIKQQYDTVWQIIKFFAPTPWGGVPGLIIKPLGALVVWLVYGLLAYLFAKLLGGDGTLGQTYGCLALAISPQLVNLLDIFPYVNTQGVAAIWAWVCGFIALKTAHRISGGRAFWAAVLPVIVMGLFFFLLLALLIAIIGAVVPNLLQWLTEVGGLQ